MCPQLIHTLLMAHVLQKKPDTDLLNIYLSFWVILPHLQQKFTQAIPKQKVHLHDRNKGVKVQGIRATGRVEVLAR